MEGALADLMAATLTISKSVAHAIFFTPRAAMLRVEILEAVATAFLTTDPKEKHALSQQKRQALRRVMNLTTRTKKLMQTRHSIMHDAWGSFDTDEGPAVFRQPVQRLLESGANPVPVETLRHLVERLRKLIDDTDDLADEFTARPPSMADLRNRSTKAGSSS